MKTLTVKVERLLATTPQKAYAAWLNPKIPGNAWHEARKVILSPKVDGLGSLNTLWDSNPRSP